jgi:hypothetical protein
MLKLLLSLIPNHKLAYLVLHADSKKVLGILRPEVSHSPRYSFQSYDRGQLVGGNSVTEVLEEALGQPVEVEFTVPQDLQHSA